MSAGPGPWWHSAQDVLGDEDPLAQHVSARAGRHEPPPPTDADHGDDPGAAGVPHDPPCEVCPICRGIDHVRRTHPEVAEHLVEAARHLARAVAELLDEVGTRREDDAAAGGGDTSFQVIRLDDDKD